MHLNVEGFFYICKNKDKRKKITLKSYYVLNSQKRLDPQLEKCWIRIRIKSMGIQTLAPQTIIFLFNPKFLSHLLLGTVLFNLYLRHQQNSLGYFFVC
jgi:hypothetical protein